MSDWLLVAFFVAFVSAGYIAGHSVGKDAGESSAINYLLDKARQRAEED